MEPLEIEEQIFTDSPILDDRFKANVSRRDIDEEYGKIVVEKEFEKQDFWVRNALMQLFDNKMPDKGEIMTYLIRDQLHNKKHPGIGNCTVKKVDEFLRKAIDIYCKVGNKKISPKEAESVKWDLITGGKINDPDILDRISKRKMPLISFTARYLSEILNLNELETCIIKNHFGLSDKSYTVAQIAQQYSLGSNRIRVIRKSIIEKARKKLPNLFLQYRYSAYENLFKGKMLICIPEDISNRAIKSEIKETGILFFAFVLSILFESSHYSISPNEKYKVPRSKITFRGRYNDLKQINGIYFIKKGILSQHEMLNMYNELLALLSVRNKQDLHININTFVKRTIDNREKDVIAFIFARELRVSVQDDSFIIKGPRKYLGEYVKVALKHIGKPAHIPDIFRVIKNEHPDLKYSENDLLQAMCYHKKTFISYGRSRIFGLKSWKAKFKIVRDRSIGSFAEEFLTNNPQPCHILEIIRYVKKFKKVRSRAIRSDLRNNSRQRFVSFGEGYFGLASWNYEKADCV